MCSVIRASFAIVGLERFEHARYEGGPQGNALELDVLVGGVCARAYGSVAVEHRGAHGCAQASIARAAGEFFREVEAEVSGKLPGVIVEQAYLLCALHGG